MADTYTDAYSDSYDAGTGGGGGGSGGSGGGSGRWFDSVTWPALVVKAAFTTPAADCIVGSGVLGTDTIGGSAFIDISADVRSVRWQRGRDSDIDTANPGECTIVLNNASGDYDPTNTSGPYTSGGVSLVDVGAAVTVHAERPAGLLWPRFTGEIADIEIDAGWDPTVTLTIADGLENLGRAQLPVEPLQRDADTTGQRIAHLADRANWPALARQIDTGQVTLGPTLLGGTALDLMHQVEQTEFGLLYVDAGGTLVFYERHRAAQAARSVVAQADITDTSGPADLGMMELQLAKSRARTFNDTHITRDVPVNDPDVEPVEQIAQDTASIGQYGTLSFPAQVGQLLKADPEALNLAEGIVSLYKDAIVRIREVRLNALREHPAGDDLWPQLLGLTLLDRIRVTRSYAGSHTITSELLIQSISEEITSDPPGWEIRFATSEPPPPVDFCELGAGLLGTDTVGW